MDLEADKQGYSPVAVPEAKAEDKPVEQQSLQTVKGTSCEQVTGIGQFEQQPEEVKEEQKSSPTEFDDIGLDSYYPLMTQDPAIKKEYVLKITDKKLENVFDKKEPAFNLQSIYIEDNYIGK